VFTNTKGCTEWTRQEPGLLFPFYRKSRTLEIEGQYICYINGGAAANCPCVWNSEAYPGAAYRVCTSRMCPMDLVMF
jgi:hypothetical protein